MTGLFRVLAEIRDERLRQDEKWGGPDHDNQHAQLVWIELIRARLFKATYILYSENPDYKGQNYRRRLVQVAALNYRRRLVQVAALVVAAIEAMDRKSADSPP